jgi:hypothetical protein
MSARIRIALAIAVTAPLMAAGALAQVEALQPLGDRLTLIAAGLLPASTTSATWCPTWPGVRPRRSGSRRTESSA